mmetsp:Transcript_183418/g.581766  ORF Transcript_183418/g.581766 Transcript_183418/m.581766 type:complete len:210 (-) Transcript_183418:254-883(-)
MRLRSDEHTRSPTLYATKHDLSSGGRRVARQPAKQLVEVLAAGGAVEDPRQGTTAACCPLRGVLRGDGRVAEDVGRAEARMHHGDLDMRADLRHLEHEALAEAAHGELGCAIAAHVRPRDDAGDRAHDQQARARCLTLQHRQESFGRVHNAEQVDAHHLLGDLQGLVAEVAHGADAGVRGDEVHAATDLGSELLLHAPGELEHPLQADS